MSGANKSTSGPGFWQNHSRAWRESGLTQQAYCEQEGISFRSFIYQHNRLSQKKKQASLHFVEASPETVGRNNQATSIQLLLPNGIRIGISNDAKLQLIQGILDIAGGIEC
jgi:hypothetical protein